MEELRGTIRKMTLHRKPTVDDFIPPDSIGYITGAIYSTYEGLKKTDIGLEAEETEICEWCTFDACFQNCSLQAPII